VFQAILHGFTGCQELRCAGRATTLLALEVRTLLISAAKSGEVQNTAAVINVMIFRLSLHVMRMTPPTGKSCLLIETGIFGFYSITMRLFSQF
jgi:hypothetical protein